jgi:hypothetical protein
VAAGWNQFLGGGYPILVSTSETSCTTSYQEYHRTNGIGAGQGATESGRETETENETGIVLDILENISQGLGLVVAGRTKTVTRMTMLTLMERKVVEGVGTMIATIPGIGTGRSSNETVPAVSGKEKTVQRGTGSGPDVIKIGNGTGDGSVPLRTMTTCLRGAEGIRAAAAAARTITGQRFRVGSAVMPILIGDTTGTGIWTRDILGGTGITTVSLSLPVLAVGDILMRSGLDDLMI